MLGVGSVLVDLDGSPPGSARNYLQELHDRLGRSFRIDARWSRGTLADIPGDIRILRHPTGADAFRQCAGRWGVAAPG